MSRKNVQQWLAEFRQETGIGRHQAQTISILSGKGGVGKTSLAISLAKVLAKRFQVLLIDCDYNLSNTAVKLNLPLNNNFYELVRGEKTFTQAIYRPDNFHLLAGCNGNIELFENALPVDQIIIEIMAAVENQYDYILLDCPAGMQKRILNLNAYCDYRFIVATADKASLTDAYALIKILQTQYGIRQNYLVANKIATPQQFWQMASALESTVENFLHGRLHILGQIGIEPGINDLSGPNLSPKLDQALETLLENFQKNQPQTAPLQFGDNSAALLRQEQE
ncbi:MAG: AAA family ATPase [Bacteriovoracaceae bacterium]|nr:AAA family ATPase [Bacteriovoracaceae bacterium]